MIAGKNGKCEFVTYINVSVDSAVRSKTLTQLERQTDRHQGGERNEPTERAMAA